MGNLFDLSGSVALVTGGASGLGRAVSLALAEAGADIAVTHRRGLRGLQERVQQFGRRLVAFEVDLVAERDEAYDELVSRTVDQLGGLDVLVNNAGTTARASAFDLDSDDWHRVLRLNLTVPFLLSRAAAQHMVTTSHGAIINIASLLSFQGGMNAVAYASSKSGLAGLTRALANEWASLGIRVNAIAPGYMETELSLPLREDRERYRSISERIPAKRWGIPEDIAGAAVYLASDAAQYVHGTILVVDGGWLAR